MGAAPPNPPLRAVHDGGYAPKPPLRAVHDGGYAPKPPLRLFTMGATPPNPRSGLIFFPAGEARLEIPGRIDRTGLRLHGRPVQTDRQRPSSGRLAYAGQVLAL